MSPRVLLLAFLVAPAQAIAIHAAAVIDQQHSLVQSVGGSITFEDFQLGQTFTVGQSGILSQVDLTLGKIGSPVDNVLLEIRNVTGGTPVGGAPLYETTIPIGSVPLRGTGSNFPFMPVDISAANLAVTAGEQLALVVSRDAPYGFDHTVVWERGLPGYTAGSSMDRFGTQSWSVDSTPYDYGFRTWVDSSPPDSDVPGPGYRLIETTRPLPPNDMVYQGQVADDGRFVGVNFEIVRPTRISSVGARFYGGAPNDVFAAIVELNDRNGAPNPTDLSGSDVLGTTLIDLPAFGSGPADASGELDLTLQPGHYGLWFGSGKFGATGDGFLYTENDPAGAWYLWTLQQPSGARNFISSNARIFIDAASDPGTIQLRSVVDVAAENFGSGMYTLSDGDNRIELDSDPFGSDEKRGILEFDISDIPTNAVIERVTLEVDTNGRSTNGTFDPRMEVYGYVGNGVATPSDALQTGTLVATSQPLEDLGMFSVEIDPAYVESILGSEYLGLLATSENDYSSIDFHPTENRGSGEPPLLTIEFYVPGDFNGDLDVDGRDFLAWQRGESPSPLSASDLALWRTNYNAAQLAGVTVPEPRGLLLLALSSAGIVLRRK